MRLSLPVFPAPKSFGSPVLHLDWIHFCRFCTLNFPLTLRFPLTFASMRAAHRSRPSVVYPENLTPTLFPPFMGRVFSPDVQLRPLVPCPVFALFCPLTRPYDSLCDGAPSLIRFTIMSCPTSEPSSQVVTLVFLPGSKNQYFS